MNLCTISDFFSYVMNYLGINSIWDVLRTVVDIGIVSFVFYKFFSFVRDSRTMQLVKGVIIIVVIALIASLADLRVVSYFINLLLELMPIMILFIFLPEIRRVLEGLGTNTIKALFNRNSEKTKETLRTIDEVSNAVYAMSEERVGALIVFERETNLTEVCETGSIIDASVSAQLLRLIFVPNTPLHDGAVIIRGNKIHAAACILPLSDDRNIDKDLGTRHRAGIGISERTDCVTVIVSEETGYVSLAINGELNRNISKNNFKKLLGDELIKERKHSQTNHNHKKRKGDGENEG